MDLLQNVDKVQKNICGTVDLTLAVSFEPFAHRQVWSFYYVCFMDIILEILGLKELSSNFFLFSIPNHVAIFLTTPLKEMSTLFFDVCCMY